MKRLIIIPLSLISLIISGTNYYVKNEGNDSNSGLSDIQAWAHHPWMSTWTGSVVLAPSDTVYMKRDNIWSIANPSTAYMKIGQSGTAGKFITTTAYGTGSKPIINISTKTEEVVINGRGMSYIKFDNLDISHWDKVKDVGSLGNYTGIILGLTGGNYSHDWVITNCNIHNCPYAGIIVADAYDITIGDITATTTATQANYSNNIYYCGYAGIGFQGCDPVTLKSNFYVYYNYIHDLNTAGTFGDNVFGVYYSSGASSPGATNYCYTRYNYIYNIPTWHGLDCHNGKNMYWQDNYIKNCWNAIGTAPADKGGSWTPVLDHNYIERNIIENSTNHPTNSYMGIVVGGETPFYATNNYIRDNIIFYTSRPSSETSTAGIKLFDIDGAIISGNHIYNGPLGPCQGAILLTAYDRNITISNNFIENWYYSIFIFPVSVNERIDIYNNIIYSHGVAISCETSGSFNGDLNLYNNVILVSVTNNAYFSPIRFNTAIVPVGSSLRIKNNIVGYKASFSSGRYILAPNTVYGTLEIDYNLYWNSTRADPYSSQGTYNWSNWNKAGYDIHSINNTDPLFRNSSGSYSKDIDFELQSNSPAIDTGKYVGLTSDYFGALISGLPDIGAVETQTGVYTPTYLNSVIEDATPSLLEMAYNAILANKVPPPGDFTVMVNGITKNTVTSVAVSGNKVLLTLTSAVSFGNNVTVSYTKTGTEVLQTNSGNKAADLANEAITNNCKDHTLPNDPPTAVLNYPATVFSGFVYELNASGSTDPNNDVLDYSWTAPPDIPVSDTTGPVIKFLSPVVSTLQDFEFRVKVSDRRDPVYKSVSINIMPYKPELTEARIENIEASDYQTPYYPINMTDDNITTRWSANGDNQWLLFKLGVPFKINHLELAFLQGQKYESYFDIFASKDNLTWDPILINTASCNFSGERQVFDFPASRINTDYSFLKLIGHGSSMNTWNDYSELKMLGVISENQGPADFEERNVIIYPNPADNYFNISMEEPTLKPDLVLLIDYSGRVVFESPLETGFKTINIPDNITSGNYIIELRSGDLILDTQILIIDRAPS